MGSQAKAVDAGAVVDSRASGVANRLRDIVALTKPRLSSLVVFTAGGGLWMANPHASWDLLVRGVGGTTLVVAGANALNQYLERDTDGCMSRTQGRPLPAGRMVPPWALGVGVLLCIAAMPLLLSTTPLASGLAVLAALLYIAVYTPLKRRSPLSTFVGAIPGALPPLIGWTAATGRIDAGGLILFAFLFFWQLPHAIAIGIFRRGEYERAGLRVAPIGMPDDLARALMAGPAWALVPLPWALFHLHLVGLGTVAAGTLSGLAFALLVTVGAVQRAGEPWARRVFYGSLLHLSFVFAVAAAGF